MKKKINLLTSLGLPSCSVRDVSIGSFAVYKEPVVFTNIQKNEIHVPLNGPGCTLTRFWHFLYSLVSQQI